MKKLLVKTILLAGMFLALTGCDSGEEDNTPADNSVYVTQSSQLQELPIGSDVTIYLVLGEIGKYNNQKGQDYPDLFLENAVKFDTKVGNDLPTAKEVTSTSGAAFKGWVKYDGNGALTKYEKAPGYQNTILYANFVG